ncbi:Holliday junction branch migration DNA helicase RuvB [Candidatus Peregrinibacteria bacterium]|nr:Holliday junction branch migration DNA helicase RuvB [Candidatus Peregrinibacteria bacterium]
MALKREQKASRIVEPRTAGEEGSSFETSLRPQRLAEYIGQSKIKGHLLVHIEAAKSRKEALGHTLLHGPPGLGKTTLAHIIAREMGVGLRITSGPVLEKTGDLASILTNLQEGEVLFIDEVHRMRPIVEEMLYSAMEDYALDLVIGKGPTARSMRLKLKPFTLIAATTKAGAMSAPLRDRFIHAFKLGFYEVPEMHQIVERSGNILSVTFEDKAAYRIATASRATPRIANRLIRSVRDYAQVQKRACIDLVCVNDTLKLLDIDDEGLDATDRQILETIIDNFSGGPVGLGTIAAMLAEEEGTVEDVYEPFLLQQGYLDRTSKGRVATKKAYEKCGRAAPKNVQPSFL